MTTFEPMTTIALIAGAGSFMLSLYLVWRNRRLQEQVNALQEEMDQHKTHTASMLHDVRNAVRPNFVPVGATINDSINRIDIKVQNKGEAATIRKLVTSTPDIEFPEERQFPLRIEHNEFFVVTGISTGQPLAQCRYVVQLHYTDQYNTQYLTAIRGEGSSFKIQTTEKES